MPVLGILRAPLKGAQRAENRISGGVSSGRGGSRRGRAGARGQERLPAAGRRLADIEGAQLGQHLGFCTSIQSVNCLKETSRTSSPFSFNWAMCLKAFSTASM